VKKGKGEGCVMAFGGMDAPVHKHFCRTLNLDLEISVWIWVISAAEI